MIYCDRGIHFFFFYDFVFRFTILHLVVCWYSSLGELIIMRAATVSPVRYMANFTLTETV